MNILFIGDIVGRPGREAVAKLLPSIKEEFQIKLVIANAENAAGGSGITPSTARELFLLGCDVLTSGDHIWKRREVLKVIDHPFILRPANLPRAAAGKGFCLYEVHLNDGQLEKVAVLNLGGRVFMQGLMDCPFTVASKIIEQLSPETKLIIVDIHAEATSEKVALGYFLDGQVSAVLGTHTHIQTADERILPCGTAYITDVGMTGPLDSVIGRRKEDVLQTFLSGMPTRFEVASKDVELQGVIIEIDKVEGKALSIKRIKRKV